MRRRFSAVLSAHARRPNPSAQSPSGPWWLTLELASVEGMRRSRGGIRVRNNSYVKQLHVCIMCGFGVKQRNYNYTHQYANVKVYAKKQRLDATAVINSVKHSSRGTVSENLFGVVG